MRRELIVVPLLAVLGLASQTLPTPALPPQIPVAGAPTAHCSFERIDAGTPIRITTGEEPIPYQFACGLSRPDGACIANTLSPGLVVSLGEERAGWACVTGGDSTAGWIPAKDLAPVPATPRAPLSEWLGWWRHVNEAKGVKNDRLLITRGPGSDVLHLSGRAYWYGLNDNVHFGEVQADAAPIGVHLHAVQTFTAGACVVDLKLDQATQTLKSYDNMRCGGMNVHFAGAWIHFTPKSRSS